MLKPNGKICHADIWDEKSPGMPSTINMAIYGSTLKLDKQTEGFYGIGGLVYRCCENSERFTSLRKAQAKESNEPSLFIAASPMSIRY